MHTLDEFIKRLEELRIRTGGDVPVVSRSRANVSYKPAGAVVDNLKVVQENSRWTQDGGDTQRVIEVF